MHHVFISCDRSLIALLATMADKANGLSRGTQVLVTDELILVFSKILL